VATAELLVDTDVLIDHLRGQRRLRADTRRIGISVVSRCELFAGRDEARRLRRFLWPMMELPIDVVIAELAGMTRRDTGIATHDALVAATALTHPADDQQPPPLRPGRRPPHHLARLSACAHPQSRPGHVPFRAFPECPG